MREGIVNVISPKRLADLSEAFDALENGEAVALWPGDPGLHYFPPKPASGGCVGVCSSGSTGRPKLVWREWDQCKSEIVHGQMEQWTWASPFAPWTFAGFQVALQAWGSGGKAVSVGTDWPCLGEGAEQVDAFCCTPTYADLLLQHRGNTVFGGKLKRLTLGGEPLRPWVGRRLRTSFPKCVFTVIYAAAEIGVLMKTHRMDGCYEIASLEKRFPRWRIQQGVLQVFTNQWRDTGDHVEIEGSLIRVTGRRGTIANIGGTKIDLQQVEHAAEEVNGVRRAAAVVERNAVIGEIVCLRIEMEPGQERNWVSERLETHLRGKLRKEAWPRRWVFENIGLGPNCKKKVHV